MKNSKNHQKTIEKCLLGKKIAPEYLDFQLQLGRNYEFIQRTDSARYYYKMILDKNPKYEEAFLYLINLDITEKKYDEALATAQKAIFIYPKSILYYQKEAEIYNLLGLKENEKACLKKILLAFPNDTKTVEQLNQIIQENKNSRIGINYNYTFINRDKIGPWHLVHLEYINDQKWGSLIGRLSYAERFAFATVFKGIQYEVESYYRIN
ncbi:MAG: tetratricopeptide repeat protein, partial [Flavobacterium sp.]